MNNEALSPLITMQRQHQCARHNVRPIIDNIKKTSSEEMMSALLTLKEEHYEDITACTAASDHCSNSEKTSQNSNLNEQNEDFGNHLNNNEDIDSHEAVNGKDDDTDMDKKNDEQTSKGVCHITSDIPTSIIPISSHGDNDDDCSNDTVSTLGVDSSLNDNPRSIFSSFWDGKDLKNVPGTVQSKSPSRCTSATSLSVASSAISSSASVAIHLAHRMETEMHLSRIPRHDSIKSDIDEYEIALREYLHGRNTIPRAAALNEQRDFITGTSIIDDKSKAENNGISPKRKQHGQPSAPRRDIFSNKYSSQLPYCRSTSALTQQQRYRSCLRPLGRSLSAVVKLENTDGESEVGGKVTFAPNVKVLEYGRPHIIQASSRGWSKHFV